MGLADQGIANDDVAGLGTAAQEVAIAALPTFIAPSPIAPLSALESIAPFPKARSTARSWVKLRVTWDVGSTIGLSS
jgi:hypothetical protein